MKNAADYPTTGEALVTLLCEVLSARAGEVLTPQLIEERARNAAQALICNYEIRPMFEEEPS